VNLLRRAGLLALATVLAACQARYELAGTELTAPRPAPHIALQSAGGPVSLDDFKGKYTYVYFGYTFCPDVCPATMATLRQVREDLGADAELMQVVMVTVDPERDTPETLAKYLRYFDDSFVGLSGSHELIDQVGEPFGLYYSRHEGSEATGYLVNHTARLYLLDRDSNAILTYSQGTPPDVILQDLQHLIGDR
jgi:protein SCO1/2